MSDAAQIDAARHRIALRIEQLTGQTPPPMGGTGAGSGGQNGGSGGSSDGSGSGSGIGGNGATSGDTAGGDATPTTADDADHRQRRLLDGARPAGGW